MSAHSPRAGAAHRGVLLLALLVSTLGLALGLFLLWGSGSGDGTVASAERAVTPGRTPPADPVAGAGAAPMRRATGGAGAVSIGPGGILIPAGVRLAGEGRLEGRVLERGSGEGVAGARVELLALPPAGIDFLRRIYRSAKFSPGWIRKLDPIAVTATEADGGFRFEGVRGGGYFLEARAAWHVPDHVAQVELDSSGSGGPVDVWVRPGGRVIGRVRRADGTPVAGAKVLVFPGITRFLSEARTGDFRCPSTRSGDDGGFALVGIPPADGYWLAALGRGIAISYLTDVEVRGGEDTEVEIVACEGTTVRGRVLAETKLSSGELDYRPIAGAHVGALPRGLREASFAQEVIERTHALTDAEGRYVMRHVPPGEVDVGAFAPGYRPSRSPTVRCIEGASTEADPVHLPSGPMVSVRFVEPEGRPIPGVRASWFVTDWDEVDFEPAFTPLLLQAVEGFEYPRSDADGRLVAGPFPGSSPYRFFVVKAGYQFKVIEWKPNTEGDEIEVVLSRGGGVEGIVMDLDEAEPIPRFTIHTRSRLEPNEEAPTSINPYSGGLLVEDEGGRFRLDALSPGAVGLTFEADGCLPETVAVEVEAGKTTRGVIVRMRRGGTIRGRVVDADGEPIAGAQVAALDERGRPVKGRYRNPRVASASAEDMFGQEIAMGSMEIFSGLGVLGTGFSVSEPDGTFELSAVPAGTVVVHATHRDFSDGRSAPVAVAPGAPIEGVEVVLPGGGGIFGTVSDRFGRPVPGAVVLAFAPQLMGGSFPSPRWVRQGGSDGSGEYRIEHMEPGTYFLAVSRGDETLNLISFFGTLNLDMVTVPPDEMVRFDITDSSAAGCRVFGRVLAGGEPVGSGGIFAFGFEGENVLGLDVKLAQVQGDGSYEFTGLEPGPYRFTYEADGPSIHMSVEIPDQPEVRLDLLLPEGGIAGSVVDAASGEPVLGAEVVLRREEDVRPAGLLGSLIQREGSSIRARTEGEGTFAFLRLQEGTYQLTVGPPRWGEMAGRYAPAEPIEVEVAEGVFRRGIGIELMPSLELRGVVVRVDGEPVPRARVRAFARDDPDVPPSLTRTGDGGRFTLRSLAPGPYEVVAWAKDYADTTPQVVEVAAGDLDELRIVLHRGVEVRVSVIGPDGLPAQGATGRLISTAASGVSTRASVDRTIEGLFRGEGMSGPDGVLDLGRHAPGTYRLEVHRAGRTTSREPIELAEGPPLELEIRLD